MKNRNIDYIKKKRARFAMQHPTDLATFLKAELTICESSIVKKHIEQAMNELSKTGTAMARG